MVDMFCVCCGAETERDWHHAARLEESVCGACASELDAVRAERRLAELASIESMRLTA